MSDLSGLRGQTATGDDSKISTYHYTAAVCSDMTAQCEDIMTGQKLVGVVYQMGGEPGRKEISIFSFESLSAHYYGQVLSPACFF